MTPALPNFIVPMLSKPGTPFDSGDYFYEIKWDGTRALAFIDKDGYRLINRRRIDMTDRYPEFAFLGNLPPGTILDGEMVVLNQGKPDFSLLQSRDHARSALKIRNLAVAQAATFIVFDLLYEDHQSMMALPLETRRERLRKLVQGAKSSHLVMSEGVVGQGKSFFQEACAKDLEGVIAKRLKSPYLPGQRTDAWIKIKRGETVCCLILGFLPTPSSKDGKDHDFRSLILAADTKGALQYVGKVGSGFDLPLRKKINELLWARLRAKPILPCKIKGKWIEPGLYCYVHCMERTATGHLRAPAFKGLQEN